MTTQNALNPPQDPTAVAAEASPADHPADASVATDAKAAAAAKHRFARGVVPHHPEDPVLKAPFAHGALLFLTLRPDLDRAGLEAWLTHVQGAIDELRAAHDEYHERLATVATGFGPSLFIDPATGQPRFPDVAAPAGFAQLPPMPLGSPVPADVVFYIVAVAESTIATFLETLAQSTDIVAMRLENGYKSWPDRDVFGYRDGVRNAHVDRNEVVFVDRTAQPEEPSWADRGTYMTWMRIPQNKPALDSLAPADQDNAIGRDRDGRRLDLAAGTKVADEGPFTSATPPADAHVHKVGPRGGAGQDATQIFRRGLPFYEVGADGKPVVGLQFVSFQASLDQFDTVFNRWMMNVNFPANGTGPDALVSRGLITVEKWAFFFVPPDTDGPVGTVIFEKPPKEHPVKKGRVAVRKKLVDSNGARRDDDLAGFTFQILKADGTPVGAQFTTNSHGHATSEKIPAGDYQLTELPSAPPLTPAPPQPFSLHTTSVVLTVTNTLAPDTPPGYTP